MAGIARWLGGIGQAQGLPPRWFVARVGAGGQALLADQTVPIVHDGGIAMGGVARGVPPHKGGPKARPSKGEERVERSEERVKAFGSEEIGSWCGHGSVATRGPGVYTLGLGCMPRAKRV